MEHYNQSPEKLLHELHGRIDNLQADETITHTTRNGHAADSCKSLYYFAKNFPKKHVDRHYQAITAALSRWIELTDPILQYFEPQDYANSLYAHAMLGMQPDAEWLQEWYTRSKEKLGDFKHQNYANSLYAHAMLGMQPDAAWLQEWYTQSQGKLGGFNPQNYANSLYAHAMLGMQPDAAWLQEWYTQSQGKLGDFVPQAYANSLYAHAMLGMQPDAAWLQEWYTRSKEKLGDFKPQNYANSLHALAVLHAMGNADAKDMAIGLMENVNETQYPVKRREHLQIWTACKTMQLPIPDYVSQGTVLGIVKENIKKEMPGTLEPPVRQALETAGFTVLTEQKDRFNKQSDSLVDFVAKKEVDGKKHRVWVQADGPSHYVSTPAGSLVEEGFTQLNSHLIRQGLGPNEQLLRVPYWEVNNRTNEELANWMNEKLGFDAPSPAISASSAVTSTSATKATMPGQRRP